jgi:hypothetical protein
MSRVVLAGALLVVAGCSEETVDPQIDPGGCALGVFGDPELPIEMHIVARGLDRLSHPVEAGGPVDMILPPQGGRVIFVGAFATNLSACEVQLDGALRDLGSTQLRLDGRTTNLADRGNGWGGPADFDISTFSNVPLCPNQWASTAVYGNTFELTVSLTDNRGRRASQTLEVVPRCGEPMFEADCLCICQEDYVLGQTCN